MLDSVAQKLKEDGGDRKVVISGHADAVGPAVYNQKLSEKRSMSVMDYLIQKGVSVFNMIVEFFGEDRPADTNKTKAGRARNRRVEILEKLQ